MQYKPQHKQGSEAPLNSTALLIQKGWTTAPAVALRLQCLTDLPVVQRGSDTSSAAQRNRSPGSLQTVRTPQISTYMGHMVGVGVRWAWSGNTSFPASLILMLTLETKEEKRRLSVECHLSLQSHLKEKSLCLVFRSAYTSASLIGRPGTCLALQQGRGQEM